MRAEAIDREKRQRKEQTIPQILDPEQIRESLKESIHTGSSVLLGKGPKTVVTVIPEGASNSSSVHG
jgi:hypothetical protein